MKDKGFIYIRKYNSLLAIQKSDCITIKDIKWINHDKFLACSINVLIIIIDFGSD